MRIGLFGLGLDGVVGMCGVRRQRFSLKGVALFVDLCS